MVTPAVDAAPEATGSGDGSSTPSTPEQRRAEIIASHMPPELEADPAPPEGTGDDPPADPADNAGADPPGDGAPDFDPDTPPESFDDLPAWLTQRDEQRDAAFEERLDNQRKSLTGSFQRERDTMASTAQRGDRNQLLEDLDALSEDELGERVRKDPKAAEAIASRNTDGSIAVQQAAIQHMTSVQMPMLETASAALVVAGGDSYMAVIDDDVRAQEIIDHPGGVFGWLTDAGIAAGKKGAVEAFKGSAEYTTAIETARQEGARDALPGAGGRAPTPGRPAPASGGALDLSDMSPQQRAVQRAMERTAGALGLVEIDEIGPRTRRRQAG